MNSSGESVTKIEKPYFSDEELGEVFGRYELLDVPVNELVILPQTRGIINPVQTELERTIRGEKLINPVDIALMTPFQLTEHLDFINGIWKTNARIENYGEPRNGLYVVLIAGHSRVNAIKSIQEKEDSPKSVTGKIHNISSSAEFLNLQLIENTHAAISLERRAVAAVEMYYYGYDENAAVDDRHKWSSYKDFIRKNPGNLNEEILSDGMAFAALPAEIRNYVFDGHLYYGAGVELGKNIDIIWDCIEQRNKEAPGSEKKEAFMTELVLIVNKATNRISSKGSLKSVLSIIRGEIKYRKGLIDTEERKEQEQLILEMFSEGAVEANWQVYLNELRKEYKNLINKIKRNPTDMLVQMLKLNGETTGIDHSADIADVEKAYRQHISDKVLKELIGSTT